MRSLVRRRFLPRSDLLRLKDILVAIEKIETYSSNPRWAQERKLEWDAILYNFAVIGEAIKALSEEVKARAAGAAWSPAAKMRDLVVHRYSAAEPTIVTDTVTEDLPPLKAAVETLLEDLEAD
jgi:uncharacterized protein with HEPN domain